jgi:uncharacterized membrane protein
VIRAALWMSGALVSFSAMAIAGRQLSTELTTFQVLFFRSLGGLAVLAAFLQRSGWAQVRTQVFGTHLLRNVAHFGGQYAWFYGIALIPLTEVFAIEFTVPIWTAILAMIFLGERMTGLRALAVALGFAGILVILRPGVEAISVPALVVLGGALCFAISHIFMKRLSGSETPVAIPFYMTVIQLPIALLPALPHWVWPSAASGHGWDRRGDGVSAHYCLAVPSSRRRNGGRPASCLPLIAVIGFAFYGGDICVRRRADRRLWHVAQSEERGELNQGTGRTCAITTTAEWRRHRRIASNLGCAPRTPSTTCFAQSKYSHGAEAASRAADSMPRHAGCRSVGEFTSFGDRCGACSI